MNNEPAFAEMIDAEQAAISHYLNQLRPGLLVHMCVIWIKIVKAS